MLNTLHICTANVKGLRDKQKRLRFYEWVKHQKSDITFIQESHFDKNLENTLCNESKQHFYFSHGTTSSRGVAILINNKLQHEIIDEHKDNDGRIIMLNIEIENIIYSLINIYAPNNEQERNSFYKKLNEFIHKNAVGIVIIGGDMNDALSEIDRKCTNKRNIIKKPVNSLKSLIKSNRLIDIWRNLNPHKVHFTWRRQNPTQASRIDMFLIKEDFLLNIKSCDIRPIFIKCTDHQAVSLKIQSIAAESKGPGYWKLNNSILEDSEYKIQIEKLINKYTNLIDEEASNLSLLWDSLKLEIKNHSIKYCKTKSRNQRNEINKLEKELKTLTDLNNKKENEMLNEKIKVLEKELESCYEYKAKGAQIRSRQEWIEKGEKNNSYFLGLEKNRQTKKTILKLWDEEKKTVTDQNEILKIEKKLYEKLYSKETENIIESINYIENTNIGYKLSEQESQSCDGYLTLQELTIAVNNLKPNKSPGMDGISTNFYKHFWKLLGPLLVKIFNSCYDKQTLPFSQRQSILNLIYKKNNPLDLSNYRPISLLNTDYKILSYTLALRIKKVLNLIINSDQTGYLQNRYIGFNLRQIQDIIHYADKFNVEGAILFIDFSKAFDTLHWNFMYQSLTHFGFNQPFINWIKTLYTDINISIYNNGWISAPIKPEKGIKQGCPCSSLLFVISVEIMATRLRNHTNIKGIEIKLDGKTHSLKISQLADDTTLFLKSKDEINIALNIIEIFGTYSGLTLNRNKTEGIWIGKLKHCKDKVNDITFTDKPIKVLGIYFSTDKKECEKLNWESKLEKAKNLMKSWEKRHLSIIGKILIVKSLIIPQFTYVASSTPLSKNYIDLLEKEIFKFIWNGKPDKVKRNTLIADYGLGGLNMIDIKSYFFALKIKWVSRLINATTENWVVIPKLYFNKLGKDFLIFKMNLGKENIKLLSSTKDIPDFYLEIIKCWAQIKGGETNIPTSFRNIRKEIIWGNRYIKFNNKPLIMLNWINSNIIYINDLIDNEGNILSENLILNKLKVKSNWMSEINILKQAIPKIWKEAVKTEDSRKTQVNIDSKKIALNKKEINIQDIDNKFIYQLLVKNKTVSNIGINKWIKQFNIEASQIKNTLYFIHSRIYLNKLKVYRWKLISNILSNQEKLYVWKVSQTPMCPLCNCIDTYQHFFFECKLVLDFWTCIYEKLKMIHFNRKFQLKDLVIGYKIDDKDYWDFNLFLTLLDFQFTKPFI